MKKLLLSLGSLTIMGTILTIGSTGAFFTDSQTSASNIFTAGSINLLIDHSLASYNGVGDLVVVSDGTATFTGDDGSGNAVVLSAPNAAWTTIPGASWIWAKDGPSDPTVNQTDTFTKTFTWSGGTTAGADLYVAADNYYTVSVNGFNITGTDGTATPSNFSSVAHYAVPAADINPGINTITVVGENEGVVGNNATQNPAGVLFELAVHGEQTWTVPVNLTNQTFWNFSDVKPGDTGRDVISLHDPANDAWTCMEITDITNSTATSTTGGELGKYINLFLWHDTNADGIYEPGSGETPITGTAADPSTVVFTGSPITVPVNDSTTGGGPILSGATSDIGSAWCAGTLTVDPTSGAISCDGSPVGNDAQGDSTSASLVFYATQARNQPSFMCSSLATSTTPTP